MLKKVLLAVGSALIVSTAVFAANLPLQTFWDPTNGLGTINAVIQSVNGGVTGNLASLPAPVATTAATIQPLFTVTIPANTIAIGQTLHIKAFGVNDSNADARTLTYAYGAATCALTVTGTSAGWSSDFWVTQTGAATQATVCNGQQASTVLANVQSTGTVAVNAAITVTVSGTAATAGIMTLNQAWAEVLR
jgi:hypothetical protein